jgi:hypothetical protein
MPTACWVRRLLVRFIKQRMMAERRGLMLDPYNPEPPRKSYPVCDK